MAKGKKHNIESDREFVAAGWDAGGERQTTRVSCRENGITEQTYYHRRKEYEGLQAGLVRGLKELTSQYTQ